MRRLRPCGRERLARTFPPIPDADPHARTHRGTVSFPLDRPPVAIPNPGANRNADACAFLRPNPIPLSCAHTNAELPSDVAAFALADGEARPGAYSCADSLADPVAHGAAHGQAEPCTKPCAHCWPDTVSLAAPDSSAHAQAHAHPVIEPYATSDHEPHIRAYSHSDGAAYSRPDPQPLAGAHRGADAVPLVDPYPPAHVFPYKASHGVAYRGPLRGTDATSYGTADIPPHRSADAASIERTNIDAIPSSHSEAVASAELPPERDPNSSAHPRPVALPVAATDADPHASAELAAHGVAHTGANGQSHSSSFWGAHASTHVRALRCTYSGANALPNAAAKPEAIVPADEGTHDRPYALADVPPLSTTHAGSLWAQFRVRQRVAAPHVRRHVRGRVCEHDRRVRVGGSGCAHGAAGYCHHARGQVRHDGT